MPTLQCPHCLKELTVAVVPPPRYEVCDPPEGKPGYMIYDNHQRKRIAAPGYPGLWPTRYEAEIIVDDMNQREEERRG